MKKIISLITLLVLQSATWMLYACEVCKDQQPKLLKGITHGAGPQNNFDYFIMWASGVIVLITLVLSVRLLIKPKESNPDHVKYIVID